MWCELSRQKVRSNLEGSQEFVSELSSFLSINVRNSPSSHHHFRGIKLLERKTLGVSNPPRANVLLLDKNEPMCDNSLDLLLENDPKKIIALDQWCRINCPGNHFILLTFSSAVQLQITVSLTVNPQILWTKLVNLNIPKRWWRCRSEKVKNSQGIYSNTFTFNCANCETSTRLPVYDCMQKLECIYADTI
jgi:hypothetical protein